MKKVIGFLTTPAVNLIIALLLYLWLGCSICKYDGFDRFSAFYGGLFVVAFYICAFGFNGLFDKYIIKKNS